MAAVGQKLLAIDTRTESNVEQQQKLSQAYRKSMNTADQLQVELRTRDLLREEVQEKEERARQVRAQQRLTNAVNAPAQESTTAVNKPTTGPSL